MRLAIRNVQHAVELLVEYNGGERTAAEERAIFDAAVALSSKEWDDLGIDRFYRESKYLKYDLLRWHLTTPRWLLDDRILRRLQPGSVLDFGSGIGLSALAYAAAGHEVTAVEVTLDCDTVRFARFLAERLGIDGVTFTDQIPPEPFANITCVETFEHFPDWTPWARALVAALAPGGIFYITASFEPGDDDHPYHFESPVDPDTFLNELGLALIAPHTWQKRA